MLIAILIISIVGTLAHFVYEWSNHNKIVALFAAVNESTWEHIKIALTPTFLYSLYDGFIYGANPNYFFAKFVSILAIIIIIPSIFYLYRYFAKKSILIIDTSLFYVAIISSQVLFYYILKIDVSSFLVSYLSIIGIFLLFGFYMTVTLQPLKNVIFIDPITKKYGLKGHYEEKK